VASFARCDSCELVALPRREGAGALEMNSVIDAPVLASDAPSSVGVQVVLRCRPLLPRELAEGAQSVLTCRRNEVEVAKYAAYVQRKAYLFHRVFGEGTHQRQLYKETVLPVVQRALDGYNCTVFAYGQTGTGKTFTLEGDIPKLTATATPTHESVGHCRSRFRECA
jgi:kinesin family member 11